jgi:hypothetical protein
VLSCSFDSPYAQLGWFDKLVDWMKDVLRSRGMRLTGDYLQLGGGGSFLARFETVDSAVWFKAIGNASSNELTVSSLLAQVAPKWLPEILGIHPEWNGWLSEEVGHSLYDTRDVEHYDLAADTLARLQVHLSGRTEWLINIGVQDQRLPVLQSKISPFLEMIAALMAIQPKTPPAILNGDNLRLLGQELDNSFRVLMNLGFPDSIIHGDITAGSIVTDGKRCALIDWSRSYVGFPPICCELMLNKFAPLLGTSGGWRERLWKTYIKQWPGYEQCFESQSIRLALALASLFSYVLAKSDLDDWRAPITGSGGSYLRSLARRMFAVAAALQLARGEVYGHA